MSMDRADGVSNIFINHHFLSGLPNASSLSRTMALPFLTVISFGIALIMAFLGVSNVCILGYGIEVCEMFNEGV